jgi:hypothetical protein
MNNQSPEFKAATRFWNLIGRPDEFAGSCLSWSVIMRDCIGESEFDLDTFLEFLRWAVTTNPLSAEYLRLARDPARTLQKNLPTLLRYFNAFQARLKAVAERDAKLKPSRSVPTCKCGRPKPCTIHDRRLA